MTDTMLDVLSAGGIFLLAGVVKGVIGLGLPTVSMGLLGLTMPPAQAAALLLMPSFVTNVWQLLQGQRLGSLLRRLWPMLLAVMVCAGFATGIIAGGAAHLATAALGGVLLLYAVLGLMKRHLIVPRRAELWAAPVVGVVTGLLTGATGVFVIPAVPYLTGLGLERDDLIQALGLSFTVSTVALGAGLAWHHALPLHGLGASILAVAPALLGMVLGGWLRARVQPDVFRRAFFLGLLALGAELLWRALA